MGDGYEDAMVARMGKAIRNAYPDATIGIDASEKMAEAAMVQMRAEAQSDGITKLALDYGFTREELSLVTDPRLIRLLNDFVAARTRLF